MQDFHFDEETKILFECAIIELESRFEIMQKQFMVREKRNIIKSIESRLKSEESTHGKLLRKGLSATVSAAREHLFDVAGVRVILGFIDDVYKIADILKSQNDLNIVSVKDYIKNPKPNGYRSYHLTVNLPIRVGESTYRANAEIQLRTIAMDFWASLEHELKYKKNIKNQTLICSELKRCADEMASADVDMQAIRDMIVKGE